MKTILVITIMLAVLVMSGGCTYYDRAVVPARVYSAAEIDAINAENQCRRVARSLLEAVRCGPNERR
jgi:hypothetical protein